MKFSRFSPDFRSSFSGHKLAGDLHATSLQQTRLLLSLLYESNSVKFLLQLHDDQELIELQAPCL